MKPFQTSSYPKYSYPLGLAAGLIFDLLSHKRRSFKTDAQACLRQLKPPLCLTGKENIPKNGPVLITFNHYYRSGFHAWWLALAIAAVVPEEIHFGMTGELTFPGRWYAPLGQAFSRWLLRRLAQMYGLTIMPPMPPRPKDVEARAIAVREILNFARGHPRAILAVAPEGSDNVPSGALTSLPSGAGRFISLLVSQGFPILPIGAFEEAEEFCLNFGPAYHLPPLIGQNAGDKDRIASKYIMAKIALQLPEHLRGPYI